MMRYWMIDTGGLRYVVLQAQRLDTAVRRAARTLCAEDKIDANYSVTFNVRRISKKDYNLETADE